MNSYSTQIVISLSTLLLSGLVSVVVSHFLNSSKAERDFKRQKMELLYLGIQRYVKTLNSRILATERFMSGIITLDQANELLLAALDFEEEKEKNEMTINIYFPRLLPAYQEIGMTATSLQIEMRRFVEKEGREDGKVYPDDLLRLATVGHEVVVAHHNFNDSLFRESKKLR